jgi:hypothetical protein
MDRMDKMNRIDLEDGKYRVDRKGWTGQDGQDRRDRTGWTQDVQDRIDSTGQTCQDGYD